MGLLLVGLLLVAANALLLTLTVSAAREALRSHRTQSAPPHPAVVRGASVDTYRTRDTTYSTYVTLLLDGRVRSLTVQQRLRLTKSETVSVKLDPHDPAYIELAGKPRMRWTGVAWRGAFNTVLLALLVAAAATSWPRRRPRPVGDP